MDQAMFIQDARSMYNCILKCAPLLTMRQSAGFPLEANRLWDFSSGLCPLPYSLLWNNPPLALGRLKAKLIDFEGLRMVLGCFWAAFGVSWLFGAAIGDSQVTLGNVFGRPLASHGCFWQPSGALRWPLGGGAKEVWGASWWSFRVHSVFKCDWRGLKNGISIRTQCRHVCRQASGGQEDGTESGSGFSAPL